MVVVMYCHQTDNHPAIMYHQTIDVVHAMQNGVEMRMIFDEEVTHIICYRCEYHPITIEDIAESLHAIGYNTSLFVNSLA